MARIPLVRAPAATQFDYVNPIVIVPAFLIVSGLVCFAILPLPLWLRGVVLLGDLVAAGLIWFVLWRRNH